MHLLSIILQSWLLFSMAFFGFSKLAGAKHQIELFESIQFPQWFRVVTGVVQIAAVAGLIIGYWYPGVASWTGIGVGIMMLIAVLSHVRVKHSFGKIFPAVLNIAIAVAVLLLFAEDLAHPFS